MHHNIHYHYFMFKETLISYTFSRTLESQHWEFFNYPLLTMKSKRKTKEEYFYKKFRVQLKSLTNLFFNCSSSSLSILVPQVPLFQPNFLISALMCFSPYKPICKLPSHNLERFLKWFLKRGKREASSFLLVVVPHEQ